MRRRLSRRVVQSTLKSSSTQMQLALRKSMLPHRVPTGKSISAQSQNGIGKLRSCSLKDLLQQNVQKHSAKYCAQQCEHGVVIASAKQIERDDECDDAYW